MGRATEGRRRAPADAPPAPRDGGDGTIWVVGVGEDGPPGLAPAARSLVASAQVLAGGRRHLAFFQDHPAERVVLEAGLGGLDRIAALRHDRRVVVLASGDPNLFGIAAALRDRFGPAAVRVVPAVSSVQLAFARAGEGWEDARIVSAHGRPLEAVLPAALGAAKLAVLTDDVNTPPRVAAALREAGMEDCRAVVGERLGGPRERVTETTLYRLAELPPDAFDPLNVLLVLRAAPPGPAGAAFGRPDEVYAHREGLLTKAEVRAVALAYLAPTPRDTVWDVGAGAGSVALEAAALAPLGRTFAVERDPDQLALLGENVRRLSPGNVRVVAGEAPGCLEPLPDPDAVFVGGSGGRLGGILACVARRLRPGGRVVANFATVEGLAAFRSWAEGQGWEQRYCQLSVARGRTAGAGLRFAALNPVFVARAVRPR